ncbi:hypothetical protein [Tenacibaculum maritimum]|uniref:Lipoprotein n=1 Tax=Tenacibaculum maritimum NCIMB 2154 TaxID=1349785 RepID=A0A2H1EBM5_9FLAO|nr:hypothetical protein [Tenacibaculum maritimum]MCD9563674.1 hypothetical protein [Tenacibaculum maritimum]MCD9567004.1 hypothetical protein [Tenacibaculum maritimum]MCD9580359.1 hypothetical protein [Tenacibaculum maritimum]MCD9581797.1 hypothetical protein [Tenacibaculum maritimum]MCD9596230.1 hypothetical protein [Tenacibaculum maritimum]
MKNILLVINLFCMTCFAQKKAIVTDTCFAFGYKFILAEKDNIAFIKAYRNNQEVLISKTVKMCPPVYFVEQNRKNKVLQDEVLLKNGNIVKVLLMVGNEAPECTRKNKNLKYKDGFCGMNVQGIVIAPNGIRLTEFMYNDFTCKKENYLGMKDLYTFAHSK